MLKTISTWTKSLEKLFGKPQSYGSALEYYIVKNQPKDAADIDRLTREFENRQRDFYWAKGF